MQEHTHTLYRTTDPDTSREAAEQTNVKLCQNRVLDVIRSYGSDGCILDELKNDLPNMSPSQRMCELERDGKIVYIGKRKGRLGRNQRIAVATEEQLKLDL